MSAAAGDGGVATVPVAHRLFTNAPGEDGGAGFRHRRVGALPDAARLESWLGSLRPAAAGGIAWAAAAWRLGGVLHLAVARVDGAFRPDEHGRGSGHLAHAIVAPAGEDEPDRDLAAELVAAAERLARPAGQAGDLETIAGACASLEDVECRTTDRWWRQAAAVAARGDAPVPPEWPAAGVPARAAEPDGAGGPAAGAAWLEPAVLLASAADAAGALEVSWAAAGQHAGAGATTVSASGQAPAAPSAAVSAGGAELAAAGRFADSSPATAAARAVAAACLALPPRLRLALQWSVAARPLPDDRLRVALGTAPAPPPPVLAGPAVEYAHWLRERLAAGDGAAVAAVAADWRIRSWRHLAERTGAAVAR